MQVTLSSGCQAAGNGRRLLAGPMCCVLVGSVLVGAVFSASAAGAVSPGACGSVLLSGTSWLDGRGVDVMSNGAEEGTGVSCGGTDSVNGITTGSEWQCAELVNRLYVVKGWITSTWAGNGGDSSATAHDSMYDRAPAGLSKDPNGSISSVGPGDVVSINEYYNGAFLTDGHVLIVDSSGSVTSGASISLVSQNSGSPSDATPQRTATLSNGTMTINGAGDSYTYAVIGVVHAPSTSSSHRIAVISRTSTSMDVLYRNTAGGLADEFWSAAAGWNNASLPGAGNAAGDPTAISRSSTSMDVLYRNTAGGLSDEFWSAAAGWNNASLPGSGNATGDPSALHRSSTTMDVLYRNTAGGLADEFWSAVAGWNNASLPGAGNAAGDPSALHRSSTTMDVFYRNTGGGLSDEFWSAAAGWNNASLPGS